MLENELNTNLNQSYTLTHLKTWQRKESVWPSNRAKKYPSVSKKMLPLKLRIFRDLSGNFPDLSSFFRIVFQKNVRCFSD